MSKDCKPLSGSSLVSTTPEAKPIALLVRARHPDGTEITTLVQQKETDETLVEFCDYVTGMLIITGLKPMYYFVVPPIQPEEFE